MSTTERRRCARVAAIVDEYAYDLMAHAYACGRPELAIAIAALLGRSEEEVLAGNPRPPEQPALAARSAGDHVRKLIVRELGKSGITLAELQRRARASALERELGYQRRRAAYLKRKEERKAEQERLS
ncbi:MAG TPA: hypothetical protein VN253_14010 [Kofleriaceae bacterium]|nr:hypothetical protein [Kofleriaceae bacterium]